MQKPALQLLRSLLDDYTSGMTLPQPFYTDEAVFLADMKEIFHTQWLFAGHSCEVQSAGEYFTFSVGTESLLIVRDRQHQLRAYFNVCRHRGSRLTTEDRGCDQALVCPYHGWTYDLDGQLKAARFMGDEFVLENNRLVFAHVRELAGLVFVCLSPNPPEFETAIAAIAPQLSPHRLDQAKVAVRDRYIVNANWKTIIENNRECYHCQVAHPEFMAANYDSGLPGDSRSDRFGQILAEAYRRWELAGLSPQDISFPQGSWFRVSRFPLKAGFLTESLDGKMTAPLMGELSSTDAGSLRLIGLPNFWAHADADYAMTTQVVPLGTDRTQVEVTFLVHPDAVEGKDYDADNVAAVWRATSEQDWQLCENNYAGICSLAYQPGKLSPSMEFSVVSFLDWYIKKLSRSKSLVKSSSMKSIAFDRSVEIKEMSRLS